ncbi:hypothetical protein ACTXMA_14145 [Corynebacterium variabile]|uniref:hypothetical protein n=1 Tax=Corynebacterium variabile TaxID=1727 RepID=UPI003BB0EA7E
MEPVRYSLEVHARQVPLGWDLTFDNGEIMFVASLDDADDRIRAHVAGLSPDGLIIRLVIHPAPPREPQASPVEANLASATPHDDTAPALAEPADPLESSGMETMLLLLSARERAVTFDEAALIAVPWIADVPVHRYTECVTELRYALDAATGHARYRQLDDTVSRWRAIAAGSATDQSSTDPFPVTTPRVAACPPPAETAQHSTPNPAPPLASFLPEYPEARYQPKPPNRQRSAPDSGRGRHRL